jgi:hypothetical protein
LIVVLKCFSTTLFFIEVLRCCCCAGTVHTRTDLWGLSSAAVRRLQYIVCTRTILWGLSSRTVHNCIFIVLLDHEYAIQYIAIFQIDNTMYCNT